jgi:hypothetical protein
MRINLLNPATWTPLVFFFLTPMAGAQSKAAPLCDLSSLPQEVQAKLATNYSDWQPETPENLRKRDRAGWITEHPNSCPGIAIGHFESKTYLSYAFFLVSKPEKKLPGFHVVVFSRTEESALIVSHIVFESERGTFSPYSDLVIATAPPHQYEELDEDTDKPRKVTLQLDGILYEAIGMASSLFYWDRDHYAALSLSD